MDACSEAATQPMAPLVRDATLEEVATQPTAPVAREAAMAEAATQPMAPACPQGAAEAAYAGATCPVDAQLGKRPKTAFWLYQDAVRLEVAAECGANGGAKLVAAIAARWKSLDGEARAVWTDKARELKEQYKSDLATGLIKAPVTKPAKRKGSKATAKAAARRLVRKAGVKKPSGCYSLWMTENRQKVVDKLKAEGNANPSFEDVARAAGKAWMALTAAEKAPFMERAKIIGNKYKDINKACKEYKKANSQARRSTGKKLAAVKGKKPAATEKPKGAGAKAAETPQKRKRAPAAKAAAAVQGSTPKKAAAATAQGLTPEKEKAAAAKAQGPTTKKAAKKGAAAAAPAAYMDMAVLAEAEGKGFGGSFKRLAEREDMKAFPQRALLDALVASGGLLHPARQALLSEGS